jgi:hypothetical protein
MPVRQQLEITDERGRARRFTGEALSTAVFPMRPNACVGRVV